MFKNLGLLFQAKTRNLRKMTFQNEKIPLKVKSVGLYEKKFFKISSYFTK